MSGIHIRDRSAHVTVMKAGLKLDPATTALLTIDMQRDYLDPEIAESPLPAEVARSVVTTASHLLTRCRSLGVPIAHCYVSRRPEEAARGGHSSPYAMATRALRLSTNAIAGVRPRVSRMTGTGNEEVMAELVGPGDFHVASKREMDAFYLTDLDMLLSRYLRPQALLLCGINTETCVYATAFAASVREYLPVAISDCVASSRGLDHHQMALELMSRSLAWVLTAQEAIGALSS